MCELLGKGGVRTAALRPHVEANCAAHVVPIGITVLSRSRTRTSFTRKSTRTLTSGGKDAQVVEEGATKMRESRETSDAKSSENQAETMRTGNEEGNAVKASVPTKSGMLQKCETYEIS